MGVRTENFIRRNFHPREDGEEWGAIACKEIFPGVMF